MIPKRPDRTPAASLSCVRQQRAQTQLDKGGAWALSRPVRCKTLPGGGSDRLGQSARNLTDHRQSCASGGKSSLYLKDVRGSERQILMAALRIVNFGVNL